MGLKQIQALPLAASPTGDALVPIQENGVTSHARVSSLLVLGNTYDVRAYGAAVQDVATGAQATLNVTAIRAAIAAAEDAGGGEVVFPGGPDARYPINAQINVTRSNVKLSAPGGAKLFLQAAIPIAVAVGSIDTGIVTTDGNTLLADAAVGAQSVTLVAGKGAGLTAGSTVLLLSDTIVPRMVGTVVQQAEFVNVYSIAGDVLTLSRPLRYNYTTAANARIYRINWITGFSVNGLGIDGNNQIASAIGICASWCWKPSFTDMDFNDLQQRGIRMQGCFGAIVDRYRQSNGRSAGFQGAPSSLNAYAISEGGPCEGLQATNLEIDRCRHGYTTSGMVGNNGASSPLNTPGFGVPTGSRINGVHTNPRGAGWDTHETGLDIHFDNCVTIGGLTVGAQNRCVGTKFTNLRVYNCVGAAIQFGSDSVDAALESLEYKDTNQGTDEATGVDWTKRSVVVDNGVGTRIGAPQQNHIDNAQFGIWERNTTFSATGGTANRWQLTLGTGASATVSRGTLAETAPHAGKYFLRLDRTVTGSTATTLSQYFDDVRIFAGKRLTFSFEMRDSLGATDMSFLVRQHFGTGGSPSADVDSTPVVRLVDGAFRKYNVQFDVPLLTGKTIGSNENSSFQLIVSLPTAAGVMSFDIRNAKLEVPHMPTAFIPRAPADDVAACRRWYEKSYNDGQNPGSASTGGRQQMAAYQSGLSDAKVVTLYTKTVPMVRKGRSPTCATYAASSGTAAALRNVTQGIDIDRDIVAGFQSFQVRVTEANVTGGQVVSGDNIEFHWTAAVPDFE